MMGMAEKIDTATGASLVLSALDWWAEAGVDALIDEAPRHWLAPPMHADGAAPSPRRTAASPLPAAPAAVQMPDTLAAFEHWRLGPSAPDGQWPGVRIGAQGTATAPLMVMIDMPEREDQPGALLSGPAGALFDRMLAAIGQNRASICLVPYCVARPLSGRLTATDEAALGRVARAYVRMAAPQCILVAGNASSRAILGTDVATARGTLHCINHDRRQEASSQVGERSIGAVASFSPRFLFERPAAKAEAWKDLQLVMKGLM